MIFRFTILVISLPCFALSLASRAAYAGTEKDFWPTLAEQKVIRQSGSDLSVRKTRPRIYFSDELVNEIQQDLDSQESSLRQNTWNAMLQHARKVQMAFSPEQAAAKTTKGSKEGLAGLFFSLMALLQKEAGFNDSTKLVVLSAGQIEWTRAWLLELATLTPPGRRDDNRLRVRLQYLARGYDWLYEQLNQHQRDVVRTGIVKHARALKALSYMKSPSLISGHERWGMTALAEGLLSVYDSNIDRKDQAFVEQSLTQVQKYFHDYYKAQAFISGNGGSHMGWSYGGDETIYDAFLLWSVATNENLINEWLGKRYLWYMYGLLGDGKYFNQGNVFNNHSQLGFFSTILAVGIYKDPVANWFLNQRLNNKKWVGKSLLPDQISSGKNWTYIKLMLFGASNPEQAPSDHLPLAYHFDPAGGVIIRSGWSKGSTVLFISSNEFYSFNHNHLDENAISLYSGCRQIGEAGKYDKYNSRHFRNFYIRTKAHSAITYEDPDKKFYYQGNILPGIANDGGQEIYPESKSFGSTFDIAFTGISDFSDTERYTYISADAGKAYDKDRIRNMQRDVLYWKDISTGSPAIFVYDKINTAKAMPVINNIYYHHTPLMDGHSLTTSCDHSQEALKTFAIHPDKAVIDMVNGEEIYQLSGNGYPPELIDNRFYWPIVNAEHRVEIKSDTNNKQARFLNLFLPVNSESDMPDIEKTSNTHALTVRVNENLFLFADKFRGAKQYQFQNKDAVISLLTATGLEPDTDYDLYLNKKKLIQSRSNEHGLISMSITIDRHQLLEIVTNKQE